MDDCSENPGCGSCDHWDEGSARFFEDVNVGYCTRMTQSKPQLQKAQWSPDGDGRCDEGIAYPDDKRGDLLTHAKFGCRLHSSLGSNDE